MPVVNPEIIIGVLPMLLFVVFNRQVSAALVASAARGGAQASAWARCSSRTSRSACPRSSSTSVSKLRQLDLAVYDAALTLAAIPAGVFQGGGSSHAAIPTMRFISLTYSIDDFIISYFTSGTMQTLPIAIYSMTKKRSARDQRAFRHHVRGDFNHHPAANAVIPAKSAACAQGRARREEGRR